MSTKVSGITKGSAYITTDNLNCWYVNLTAGTTVLSTTPVSIYGIVVNSHSSGTIKVWDGIAGNTTVCLNTYSFATGSQAINLYGLTTGTACTVVVGGTADVTLAYRKIREYDLSNNVA
jgi:hypothetical protein